MSFESIIIAGNVGIAQAQGPVTLIPSLMGYQEIEENYGSISLPIFESFSVADEKDADIKFLFGSWAESGDEDRMIDELYASRLVPSSQMRE